MAEAERVGEVIESSTTNFVAQCYELYELPPLGSLVKTREGELEQYAIVYYAATSSLEPGRRPIARGKDEEDEEELYRQNPQLLKLLRSEFSALVVGHKDNGRLYHYLPPKPARIHSFVYLCPPEEVREFSHSLGFLDTILSSHLTISIEELISASLRQMSRAYEDPHQFLLKAGKQLSLKIGEFRRLKTILERIKSG